MAGSTVGGTAARKRPGTAQVWVHWLRSGEAVMVGRSPPSSRTDGRVSTSVHDVGTVTVIRPVLSLITVPAAVTVVVAVAPAVVGTGVGTGTVGTRGDGVPGVVGPATVGGGDRGRRDRRWRHGRARPGHRGDDRLLAARRPRASSPLRRGAPRPAPPPRWPSAMPIPAFVVMSTPSGPWAVPVCRVALTARRRQRFPVR